eukprot:2285010-Prymnesium_polylepis.1
MVAVPHSAAPPPAAVGAHRLRAGARRGRGEQLCAAVATWPATCPTTPKVQGPGGLWGGDVTDPPWGGSNRMMEVFRSWGGCLDTLIITFRNLRGFDREVMSEVDRE